MRETVMQEKDNHNLLKPNTAVEDFLDTLLQESTQQPADKKIVKLKSKPTISLLADLPLQAEPEEIIEQKTVDVEQKVPQQQQDEQQIEPLNDPGLNQSDYTFPLQCLMFSVRGNQLSIPLIDMGSVLNWTDKLTMLPGAPEWFLGILNHRGEKVKVADTARLLKINQGKLSKPQHILVFGKENWAISCDELGEVIKLTEQDVKWSGNDNRMLSLGTIKDSLAILLDPVKILQQLNRFETK